MAEATPAAGSTQRQDVAGISLPAWLTTPLAIDLIFITAIGILALALRTWDLEGMPFGLHGDEAWTGIDAQTINRGDADLIWPYTRAALGQPAGPMFWVAPFEAALGPSVLAVRLPMAVLGALTIVIGFFAMRVMFNRPVAYFWAVLAACSSWLIFYNRTGFTVPFMPFSEALSLLAVAVALKKRWWPWYVLAGAIVGAGIYGYYSYPLFAVGLGIYVLAHFAIERPKPGLIHARNVTVMGLTALLLIQPMWPYFFSDEIGYTHDRTVFAVSNTERYKAAESTSEKIDIYVDNAVELARTLLWEGQIDYSDGTGGPAVPGGEGIPALDYIAITLAVAGLALSLVFAFTRRQAAYLLPWIMIPIILIGPIWSEGGYHRRALGILVFVLMAASVALAYVVEVARRRNGVRGERIAYAVCALILFVYGAYNVNRYWSQQNGPAMLFTYLPELAVASEWINEQPDDMPVYFFSDRWSINYETSRYILDGRENLSDRTQSFAKPGEVGLPDIDPETGGILVFISPYTLAQGEDASQRYPGATRYEGPPLGNGAVSFFAYVVEPR